MQKVQPDIKSRHLEDDPSLDSQNNNHFMALYSCDEEAKRQNSIYIIVELTLENEGSKTRKKLHNSIASCFE